VSAVRKFAGVVGWPVAQSLSPTLHGFWIRQYALDAEYVALPIRPEDFETEIRALPGKGFAGVNVTIPHKEAAFQMATTLDADAKAAGAVNLLIFSGGHIHGCNTDISGFAAALTESLGQEATRQGPCVILGAGGAARAVALALLKQGADDIRILNRTRGRAEELAETIGRAAPGVKLSVVDWNAWGRAFDGAGLLVNTTSLGMTGKESGDVPLDTLPPDAAIADIVYNPLETPLLAEAKRLGHRTMDGLGMLMHQAVPAFAAWFGVTPKVTPGLRAALEAKLAGRSA